VLLSSAPPAGLLATSLRIVRRHPLVFAKVNLTRSLFPLVATPQLVREAFFSDDVPQEELLAYARQMQDESYLAFLDMVALDRPKPEKVQTPLLVLGVGRDTMLTPREIEATARAYHTQAEIIADVAHDSMLEPRWQAVAARIVVWLTGVVGVANAESLLHCPWQPLHPSDPAANELLALARSTDGAMRNATRSIKTPSAAS
jgi:hypothetical protein